MKKSIWYLCLFTLQAFDFGPHRAANAANQKTALEAFLNDGAAHQGAEERARAALQLFQIDQESEIAKSTLMELMSFVRESDDTRPDYLGIADGLKRMGTKAASLYQALVFDALTDYQRANRRIAVDALAAVVPDQGQLIQSLRRTDVKGWQVQAVVQKISRSDRELRAEVLRALSSPYPDLRQRAALVSGLMRSPSNEMKQRLVDLEADSDPRVREQASQALTALRAGQR
jgi:hypothetical protein